MASAPSPTGPASTHRQGQTSPWAPVPVLHFLLASTFEKAFSVLPWLRHEGPGMNAFHPSPQGGMGVSVPEATPVKSLPRAPVAISCSATPRWVILLPGPGPALHLV